MNKALNAMALLATAALLTACSGAPSEKELHTLLESEVSKMTAVFSSMGGEEMAEMLKVDIHSVKIHACSEQRKDVYRCDIEVDATAPIVGRSSDRSEIVVAKTANGWVPAN